MKRIFAVLALALAACGGAAVDSPSTPTPPQPEAPPPAPVVQAEQRDLRLEQIDAKEQGTIIFTSASTSAAIGDGTRGDSLATEIYRLGKPLYAHIELPFTFAQYNDRYGIDRMQIAVWLGGYASECSEGIDIADRTANVALFRDARIPSDLDLTRCSVNALGRNNQENAYVALVEVIGTSNTPGVRRRALAHATLDLGVDDVKGQLEAYALEDRHLTKELAIAANQPKELPATRMPSLNVIALAAAKSASPRDQLFGVSITSDDWRFTRDVKTHKPAQRFVVGATALSSSDGRCVLADTTWIEDVGNERKDALHAFIADERRKSIACPRKGGS